MNKLDPDVVERACEDDRIWFLAHPGESTRHRIALIGEHPNFQQPQPGLVLYVKVTLLGPGLRARSFYWKRP